MVYKTRTEQFRHQECSKILLSFAPLQNLSLAKAEDWLGANPRAGNNEATVSRSTSVQTNKCRTQNRDMSQPLEISVESKND